MIIQLHAKFHENPLRGLLWARDTDVRTEVHLISQDQNSASPRFQNKILFRSNYEGSKIPNYVKTIWLLLSNIFTMVRPKMRSGPSYL